MKEQFCKEVIRFLKSEYKDNYVFNLTLKQDHFSSTAELKIKTGCFTKILVSSYMEYFFELYKTSEYIEERDQFRWQKELIDLIEGIWISLRLFSIYKEPLLKFLSIRALFFSFAKLGEDIIMPTLDTTIGRAVRD